MRILNLFYEKKFIKKNTRCLLKDFINEFE